MLEFPLPLPSGSGYKIIFLWGFSPKYFVGLKPLLSFIIIHGLKAVAIKRKNI